MLMPSIFGENLFDDWMTPFDNAFFGRRPVFGSAEKSVMKTDVKETNSGYEVDIDLPGYRKEDISVALENGYLTITAERRADSENADEGKTFIRRERCYGSCSRSFYVGDGIAKEDITAKLEDGILRLGIPKADQKKLEENKYIAIEG